MEIGERLEMSRQLLKLNQADFAREIGASRSALNTYLSGSRIVPSPCLLQLSRQYGIDPVWILEGNGESGLTSQEEALLQRFEVLNAYLEQQMHLRKSVFTSNFKTRALRHLYAAIKISILEETDPDEVLKSETKKVLDLVASDG